MALSWSAVAAVVEPVEDQTPHKISSDWVNRLYTPTYITKLGNIYFIVDCWHHRVLYNHDLNQDIGSWKVIDDLAGPHSIATDGKLFLVDDTGHGGVRVYRKGIKGLVKTQYIDGLGTRTHRVVFDKATSSFYVLSANSQEITKLVNDEGHIRFVYRKKLSFLNGAYTRSFTIHNDSMYFTSGSGYIVKVDYKDDRYVPVRYFKVPEKLRFMNDIFVASDGLWYFTATPKTILRSKSLIDLEAGRFENIYQALGLKGTPYYMSEFDGYTWIPEITEYSGIKKIKLTDLAASSFVDFGPPTTESLLRYDSRPK